MYTQLSFYFFFVQPIPFFTLQTEGNSSKLINIESLIQLLFDY
jgi:hypothetical protein